MNHALVRTLSAIHADPKRPHSSCPGYEFWLANKVWEAAVKHCAEMSGPQCAEVILAAGVACCEQDDKVGPGWIGVDKDYGVGIP